MRRRGGRHGRMCSLKGQPSWPALRCFAYYVGACAHAPHGLLSCRVKAGRSSHPARTLEFKKCGRETGQRPVRTVYRQEGEAPLRNKHYARRVQILPTVPEKGAKMNGKPRAVHGWMKSQVIDIADPSCFSYFGPRDC